MLPVKSSSPFLSLQAGSVPCQAIIAFITIYTGKKKLDSTNFTISHIKLIRKINFRPLTGFITIFVSFENLKNYSLI